MKIKKGDTVVLLSGKDKGKKGTVVQAFPKEQRVLVDGVNMKKIHERARRQGQKGKVVEQSQPVPVSTVALIDPKDGKPTRIRIEKKDGKIKRVGVRSGQAI